MKNARPQARWGPREERLVAIRLQLAQDARERLQEVAQRRTNRYASALGAVAALVAFYDLCLLATIGRH